MAFDSEEYNEPKPVEPKGWAKLEALAERIEKLGAWRYEQNYFSSGLFSHRHCAGEWARQFGFTKRRDYGDLLPAFGLKCNNNDQLLFGRQLHLNQMAKDLGFDVSYNDRVTPKRWALVARALVASKRAEFARANGFVRRAA